MTEHKYAQVLRWVADGKKVQWKSPIGIWREIKPSLIFDDLCFGRYSPEKYRLAPRTVNVGGVEIEAPLNECSEGTSVFALDHYGESRKFDFYNNEYGSKMLKEGRLFTTREAAKAAHDAWVKLMTGESNG